ncbi:hypothetical protein LPB142_05810 [Rhodobacter xanthinilyticus]|uniref:Putative DNA-binding domain-containing protein n=1 Tax=Rhodobacter xanthinilyticus TaxID=1850250 RepID=A0A1D9MAL5_9RHOB|nr:DNA-binding domain-containing protein [Rhodobacter xanthinilyticus]AOZ68894.1 hypothetical protein LPB142_05810 [Rhodobacter xanthinilyticus]
MRGHRETLAAFGGALAPGAGAPPAGLRAPTTEGLARRFAVYRNTAAVTRARALAQRFAVIERLLGAEFFAALAAEFIARHPPQSPVLHEWGAEFPMFLKHFLPLAGYPYLADVARIDWARGEAFHAPDAAALAPARLAGADPETLRLGLHPALRWLALDTPAVAIWAQNQPGAAPAALPPGGQIALIWRRADFSVPVRAITAGEAGFLAALAAGAPLAAAAARALPTDPTALLLELHLGGALIESQPPC